MRQITFSYCIVLAVCAVLSCGRTELVMEDHEESAAPVILTTAVADALLGRPYAQRMEVRGGAPPLAWSVRAPAELGWLSIDRSTGELGGAPVAPVQPGKPFTVEVMDAAGGSNQRTFTLVVRACREGEQVTCYNSDGLTCRILTQVCHGGQFGPCDGGTGSTDPAHCGEACGSCGPNATACVDGQCRCGGSEPCSGATPTCCEDPASGAAMCVDLRWDKNHCGSCGVRCLPPDNTDRVCVGGSCLYPCLPGWARCPVGSSAGGCMTEIAVDPNNCGGCGNVCRTSVPQASVPTPACQDGQCTYTCWEGWTDCNHSAEDGCEADLRADINNCGGCGHRCPPAPSGGAMACVDGECRPSCPAGHNLCLDGTVCYSNDDFLHCGSCTTACPSSVPHGTVACRGGTCTVDCSPGYGDCDGVVSNGCESRLNTREHCGTCDRRCTGGRACVGGSCCEYCGPGAVRCCGNQVCTRCSGEYCCRSRR